MHELSVFIFVMRIEEYRKIMGDEESTDEKIQFRIDFLDALCRNIIRNTLDTYKKEITQTPTSDNSPSQI